jgi:hypothetical protein
VKHRICDFREGGGDDSASDPRVSLRGAELGGSLDCTPLIPLVKIGGARRLQHCPANFDAAQMNMDKKQCNKMARISTFQDGTK